MNYLIGIFFFFITFQTMGQDTYFQNMPPAIEAKADSLSTIYSQKLMLTGKQELQFKQKLAAFLMRKKAIKKELSGKEKLDVLYKLGEEENAEMRDVLTQEQFDLYVRLKPSVQPLTRIAKN